MMQEHFKEHFCYSSSYTFYRIEDKIFLPLPQPQLTLCMTSVMVIVCFLYFLFDNGALPFDLSGDYYMLYKCSILYILIDHS